MRQHQTEPSAVLRQMAATLWQAYVALTGEGFTESQALTLISEMLLSQMLAADLDDSDNG